MRAKRRAIVDATPPRRYLLGLIFMAVGCADVYEDVGSYRIVSATDGLFGLRCQPRTDFYYLDRRRADAHPAYLGTCGTPKFVSDQLHMPSDPSCFAISENGDSLVYFHRPNWCGAGDAARKKPGGVYRHSAATGDALLYTDVEVGQVWSSNPIGAHSMRVTWHGDKPSRSGAVKPQKLLITADGSETPEG